ncbi:FtsK/SpoIIIE domain-containing protein [Naumannella halotolerans]|uniref:FtsK/SpoIIIE domain-containing protein n=1 Tax=Naumannella halotolerans TaxID=993414 RepID=UPI00370DA847
MLLIKALRWCGLEVWWWISRLVRLLLRYWLWSLFAVIIVNLGVIQETWWPLVAIITFLVVLGLWARIWPVSFDRYVALPSFRRRTKRWLRRSWVPVMDACGLARRIPGEKTMVVPSRRRLRWVNGQLSVQPRLLIGQTVEDVEHAADRLRTAVGARRVRIVPDDTYTTCRIVWSFGDPLGEPFLATIPDRSPDTGLAAVPVGRTEDSTTWWLPLISTLVAGCTGAGKASVMWSTILALAPSIRSGLVELHGIDLKGGMELTMGRRLFTRTATTPAEAVQLLEDAVTRLEERTHALAGRVRDHRPTVAEPLVLIVVDELASLVAYSAERDLVKRAEAALSRLLSAGRAPKFLVIAFLQDPRKETVKMRHLFPQSLGLRLRDREEVAMVLGDGAVHAGAACHKISRALPGTGYVLGDTGDIVRVRAGYVTDDLITTTATTFAAPKQVPIPPPATSKPTPRGSGTGDSRPGSDTSGSNRRRTRTRRPIAEG